MNNKTYTAEDFLIESQMAIFWRILRMLIARYGNHPMGHLLVALTMVFLNERDMAPTLTDICEATGLPKASVSRYVSWQIKEGLATEDIDPLDRRRRYLRQTERGRREWQWQMKQIEKMFDIIADEQKHYRDIGTFESADDLMDKMIRLSETAPPKFE